MLDHRRGALCEGTPSVVSVVAAQPRRAAYSEALLGYLRRTFLG